MRFQALKKTEYISLGIAPKMVNLFEQCVTKWQQSTREKMLKKPKF